MERLAQFADAVLLALRQDTVGQEAALLGRTLFPNAAALRVSLATRDRQVLASVGSLLAPGPLALALVPLSASATGSAVVRQAPVFLTLEACQGLACYDFEGGAVFCLPIPAQPFSSQAGVPGALLLSFQAASQLDAAHASNLLLLAGALAPGLAAAAGRLLQQCNLILGYELSAPPQLPAAAAVGSRQGATEEEEEEEEGEAGVGSDMGSSDSEVFLEEEEMEMGSDADVAAELAAGVAPGEQGEQGEEEEEEQAAAVQQQPAWAAGGCRDDSPEPPEDPGGTAAALAVPPVAVQHAGAAAAGQEDRSRPQQEQWQPPESPSVVKARARAEASGSSSLVDIGGERGRLGTAGSGGGGSSITAASTSSGGSPSSKASSLPKSSPPEPAGSGSGSEGLLLEQAAGLQRWRLLRFADPQLERRFARWHAGQLCKLDLLSLGLTAALVLALLLSPGASSGGGGGGGISKLWLAGHLAAALLPLTALLVARSTYVRHRDAGLAVLYLLCIWWHWHFLRLHTTATATAAAGESSSGFGGGSGSTWVEATSNPMPQAAAACLPAVLLALAFQGRFCVQAPLQLALFGVISAALAGGYNAGGSHSGAAQEPSPSASLLQHLTGAQMQVCALGVAVPLLLLFRMELLARRTFLARLPLLAQST